MFRNIDGSHLLIRYLDACSKFYLEVRVDGGSGLCGRVANEVRNHRSADQRPSLLYVAEHAVLNFIPLAVPGGK
jgi:hypothetical protein